MEPDLLVWFDTGLHIEAQDGILLAAKELLAMGQKVMFVPFDNVDLAIDEASNHTGSALVLSSSAVSNPQQSPGGSQLRSIGSAEDFNNVIGEGSARTFLGSMKTGVILVGKDCETDPNAECVPGVLGPPIPPVVDPVVDPDPAPGG
jgi:hypothetical protein